MRKVENALKQWLDEMKNLRKTEGERIELFENSYYYDNEKITWVQEMYDDLINYFSDCERFYCYEVTREEERTYFVEFSYLENRYQFFCFKEKDKTEILWDFYIEKEEPKKSFSGNFRKIETDVMLHLKQKIEKILLTVPQIREYRTRCVLSLLQIENTDRIRFFKEFNKRFDN